MDVCDGADVCVAYSYHVVINVSVFVLLDYLPFSVNFLSVLPALPVKFGLRHHLDAMNLRIAYVLLIYFILLIL